MAKLFRRVVNIALAPKTAGAAGGLLAIESGLGIQLSGLDCVFHVKKNVKPEPNTAELKIYNLSKETRSLLSTQLKGLEELVLSWRAGNEKPPIPADKREAWILAAHREIIALKELAQAFEDAAAASKKKPKDKEKTEAVKNN